MTKERFQERFETGDEGFIVRPKNGAPFRPDGQALTVADQEILAGRDPLANDSEYQAALNQQD